MKISNIINTLFIGVFLISGTIFLEGKNRQEKEIFFYSFSFFFCILFIQFKLHDKKYQILQLEREILG